jgi:hypothetical protein
MKDVNIVAQLTKALNLCCDASARSYDVFFLNVRRAHELSQEMNISLNDVLNKIDKPIEQITCDDLMEAIGDS